MRAALIFAIAVAAIALNACKDSPTGNNTTNSNGRPGTGSTYEYDYYDMGSTTPDGTFRFVAGPSGITYYGKSNVVVYDLIPDALILDSMAFAYNANGDVETPFVQGYGYNDVEFYVSGWTPMGTTNTGTNRTLATYDTSAVIDGIATTFSFRRTGSYVGAETMQVGGTALAVHRALYRQTATVRGGRTLDAIEYDTVWYAPSIGMMAKWASYEKTDDELGTSESGQTWILKSYTRK